MPANSHSGVIYDKEPLIPINGGNADEEWTEGEFMDSNGNRIFRKESVDGLATRIQLQPDGSSNFPEKIISTHFPKERRKTFIAFFCLVVGFLCNSVSIALTHQKVPDRTKIPPLPDIFLDNVKKQRWLNDVADILVIVCTLALAVTVLLHKYRWIVARRLFVMISLLYAMRSVTMYVTVLPLANTHVVCSPKVNYSTVDMAIWVTGEVVQLIVAGGLPITGKKTLCGDYIYSGHTIIFLMAYLLIREYTPRKLGYLHWTFWGIAWFGMIALLISHGHYTIDIIIGYYATTRIFWLYHVLANNPNLKEYSQSNFLSEVWWFKIFQYFESNVEGSLPRRYSIPRFKTRRHF